MFRCRATCSLYLILTIGVHADGWSTNIWPSQEHPMEGWRQLQECYTATLERCTVVNATLPTVITNRFQSYEALTNLKHTLRLSLTNYLDLEYLGTSTPVVSNYLAQYTNSNPDDIPLPFYTATNLLWQLYLPTNYFEYTSPLGFSGLGSHTTDVSMTYPHGFTNVSTQAGGTNFPASRGAWYDTDYGIASYTNIIARLRITKCRDVSVNHSVTNRSGWSGDKATWADAVSAASSGWFRIVEPYTYGLKFGAGSSGIKTTWPLYSAELVRNAKALTCANVSTSYVHTVEYYVHTTKHYTYGSVETNVYDNFGASILENVYAFIGSTNDSADASYSLPWESGTNAPLPFCSEPTILGYRTYRGYRLTGFRAFLNWTGFQFK